MGLLDAAYYLGSPVGLALVDPLMAAGGYRAVYIFVMALYVATIVYVVVRFCGENRKVDNTEVRKTYSSVGFFVLSPILLIYLK